MTSQTQFAATVTGALAQVVADKARAYADDPASGLARGRFESALSLFDRHRETTEAARCRVPSEAERRSRHDLNDYVREAREEREARDGPTVTQQARILRILGGLALDLCHDDEDKRQRIAAALDGSDDAALLATMEKAFGKGPKARPLGLGGPVIALEVRGGSMLPRFAPGDTVYIQRNEEGVPAEAIGKNCAVRLTSGETYLGKLEEGTEPGRYTLTHTNADPRPNLELEWAASVLFRMPAVQDPD